MRLPTLSFLKIMSVVNGPLIFHMSFRIHFLNSAKNVVWVLIGIPVDLWVTLGDISSLILSLPIIKNRRSFHLYLWFFPATFYSFQCTIFFLSPWLGYFLSILFFRCYLQLKVFLIFFSTCHWFLYVDFIFCNFAEFTYWFNSF